MAGFLYGLLGGIVAWAVTTFFGQPLVIFLRLRSECATELARFREDDERRDDPDQPKLPHEWWHERRAADAKCGVDLVGFAASNQTFVRFARQRWLGDFRVNPKRAGDELVLLGQMRGTPKVQVRQSASWAEVLSRRGRSLAAALDRGVNLAPVHVEHAHGDGAMQSAC